MIEFKLELIPESKEMLRKFPREFREALVQGCKQAVLFAEGEAKRSFGKHVNLKVRTGHLRRSIKSSVVTRYEDIVGSLSSDVVYARIHEMGGIIKASTKPYLKFQINNRWITVREVTIPKRPYLRPAFEDN